MPPVSNSPPPAEDEPQEGPPGEQPEARPKGAFEELEEGLGHLIGAFEQGVINIAEAEGKKRRGEKAAAPTGKKGAEAAAPAVRAPRKGMTYEEALAPRRSRKQKRAATEAAPVAADDAATADPSVEPVDSADAREQEPSAKRAKGDPVFEPIPPRPGMTYDEALKPIRWRNLAFGIVAVALLGVIYWGVTYLQVRASADDDQTRPADVAVVLGAAQFDGTPSPVLAARLDRALELWNDGTVAYVATTGSNQEGDRFTEGFSGYVYLREAGVPEGAILTIIDGADTYQQISASWVQMQERELTTALLVSDGYHSHRLRSIADEVGVEAYVAPTSIEATSDDLIRETTAVSIGRLLGYRRLSNWATEGDPPG